MSMKVGAQTSGMRYVRPAVARADHMPLNQALYWKRLDNEQDTPVPCVHRA